MRGSPYLTIYDRLVANTHEPENGQSCWLWSGKRGGGQYGRVNIYVPGIAATVTMQAHLALYLCVHSDAMTPDELFLAWQEIKHSGLEIDHCCYQAHCINPDHLEAVTPSENCARRRNWRA